MKQKVRGGCKLLAVLLSAIFLVHSFGFGMEAQALSKMGSRGEEVRQIQTRLRDWGYMNGPVDGIYGTKTREGVKYFQRKHGLTADGVAGPKTLEKLGLPTGTAQAGGSGGSVNASSADYNLLARIISAEARGESYTGQVAVGAVIMNRIQHPSFPDTLAGVIYQKGAFTAIVDGQFNQPVADSAYKAARDALNGWDPSGGAIYYYNPRTASNQWIRSRPVIKTIGKHVFCK